MSVKKWIFIAAASALVLASSMLTRALAQHCPSGACAPPHRHRDCPPPLHHWVEGPPNIRYKHACPRPICPPCELPQWGYYQPCWRPFPYPPDSSHCPYPVPASQVVPHDVLNFPQEGPYLQPEIKGRQRDNSPVLPPIKRITYTEPPLGN